MHSLFIGRVHFLLTATRTTRCMRKIYDCDWRSTLSGFHTRRTWLSFSALNLHAQLNPNLEKNHPWARLRDSHPVTQPLLTQRDAPSHATYPTYFSRGLYIDLPCVPKLLCTRHEGNPASVLLVPFGARFPAGTQEVWDAGYICDIEQTTLDSSRRTTGWAKCRLELSRRNVWPFFAAQLVPDWLARMLDKHAARSGGQYGPLAVPNTDPKSGWYRRGVQF